MAIKQILETVGRSAVEAVDRRLRGRKSDGPSGAPSTVGAAKPGARGGPKSGTASTRAKQAKPANKRATATRAAASSGTEVKKAVKEA
jgi:hypothetical protein